MDDSFASFLSNQMELNPVMFVLGISVNIMATILLCFTAITICCVKDKKKRVTAHPNIIVA